MEKFKFDEKNKSIVGNLMIVGNSLLGVGLEKESKDVAKTILKIAVNEAGWDWTRDKGDETPPQHDFKGRIWSDGELPDNVWRRFQDIWRGDRKKPIGDVKEGYGDPSWEALFGGDKVVGMWDVLNDIWTNTYNAPVDYYRGGYGDMSLGTHESIVNTGQVRGEKMKKTAEDIEKKLAEEESEQMKEARKELGVVLNDGGMPSVDFRDGSFAEIKEKVVDARSRNQGVDAEAEYVVVVNYPSLGFEKHVGSSGYRNLKTAEKILSNYARVHLARGLTYTP